MMIEGGGDEGARWQLGSTDKSDVCELKDAVLWCSREVPRGQGRGWSEV